MTSQKENFRTHLSEGELEYFRERLKETRQETTDEIERLKASADSIDADADDVKSGVDHHPGDVASDESIKQTSLQLLEKQREKLKKIDAAFERMESGTYGICTATGEPIRKERLKAIPYAMHSVEAKTQD